MIESSSHIPKRIQARQLLRKPQPGISHPTRRGRRFGTKPPDVLECNRTQIRLSIKKSAVKSGAVGVSCRTPLMRSKTSARGQVQWRNPVKRQLHEGKPVIGAVISVNSVEVAAQAANMGFDFIWLEMEHAPLSLETVRNVVLATRGLPAVPFARPPVNE